MESVRTPHRRDKTPHREAGGQRTGGVRGGAGKTLQNRRQTTDDRGRWVQKGNFAASYHGVDGRGVACEGVGVGLLEAAAVRVPTLAHGDGHGVLGQVEPRV